MAVASIIRTEAGLFDRIVSFFQDIAERRVKRALFIQTLRELRSLDGRELADLGLNRSMLNRVAYEAVYGGKTR